MKKALLPLIIVMQIFAWQPIFDDYQTIKIGETEFKNLPIDLVGTGKFNGYPAAAMTDYTGDGLEDLVVGLFDYGSILVAENSGTIGAPKFETYTFLENDEQGKGFGRPL